MIIDHIAMTVSNVEQSTAFFTAALAPLGILPIGEHRGWVGFGVSDAEKADFWFGIDGVVVTPLHIAFRAGSRAQVDAFHSAAIEAGGQDNGAPGVRAIYHEHYYGAFVIGPDGHNVEAVCHNPVVVARQE